MKCPACYNELRQLQVGSVVVDVCEGGCGGVWFDAFELQRVDDQEEAAGERLTHVQRDPSVVVDSSRKRDCPHCAGIKLSRHYFSARRRIEVDECPNCGGYWLDAGELAAIRAERHDTSMNTQARPASLSSDTIRYLYKLRTESRAARDTEG